MYIELFFEEAKFKADKCFFNADVRRQCCLHCVDVSHSQIRKTVCKDKLSYLDKVATEAMQVPRDQTCKAIKPQRGGNGKRIHVIVAPLPALLDKSGALRQHLGEVAERWFVHFAAIEAAHATDPKQLLDATVKRQVRDLPSLPKPTIEAMITFFELEKVMRGFTNGKAFGGDVIPADALQLDPALLAQLSHPLVVTIFRCARAIAILHSRLFLGCASLLLVQPTAPEST